MTPTELSEYLQIPARTLAQWRYLGRGPKYLKLEGGHVRYRSSDVTEWLDHQRKDD